MKCDFTPSFLGSLALGPVITTLAVKRDEKVVLWTFTCSWLEHFCWPQRWETNWLRKTPPPAVWKWPWNSRCQGFWNEKMLLWEDRFCRRGSVAVCGLLPSFTSGPHGMWVPHMRTTNPPATPEVRGSETSLINDVVRCSFKMFFFFFF